MGVGGIVVSIAAFQAVDPGSIPGQRTDFIFLFRLISTIFFCMTLNDKYIFLIFLLLN